MGLKLWRATRVPFSLELLPPPSPSFLFLFILVVCRSKLSKMSSDQSQSSVRLPPRNAQTTEGTLGNKPPVWSLSEHAPAAQPAPLAAKCDRHVPVREGVCCKDLKGEDERTLVDPDVLRDVYVPTPLTFSLKELVLTL